MSEHVDHGEVAKEEAAYLEWSNAPADYTKLLNMYRQFIRGELYCTPDHGGPLDPETGPLREGLLRLYDFGFLTMGSQPFEAAKEPVQGGSWYGSCTDPIEGGFSQWRQRAYLDFLLPSAHLDARRIETFLSGLMNCDEIYIGYFLPNDLKTPYGNMTTQRYPVTTLRQALKKEDLDHATWETFTGSNLWLGAEWPDYDIGGFNDKIAVGKPIEIHIAARSWDHDPDILQIILVEALKAGLTTSFRQD